MDLLRRIGTEDWVEMMNGVLQIMESEVYRFGGKVDQFRGDGLVAFFGAPVTHEDDAERAVLAAQAMQEAIAARAAELAEREGIELLLRVGVNSGEVIVANIGDSSQHSEDTAMGEAIALAVRIEAAAEPGTVLVSENTYLLVQSQFEWEALGKISVKGMSQLVAVYRPLAPRADARRSLRLRAYGLSSLLVGCDAQFDALKRSLEDLRVGRGGIVMVTGDQGVGKSRLVAQVRQHEVRDRALLTEAHGAGSSSETLGELTWLQGRCRSYGQSWPYSMWLDLLRAWLGTRREEPEAETRDHLHRQVEALWGERTAEYYPYLATFLSLPLEDEAAEKVKHLDAEGLHQQILCTLRSWVEAMAEHGPLVLVFEDVHWADASSLELLEYCLPLCEHEAVLWLIAFRLDRTSPAWEFRHRIETDYPHRLTSLTLSPLTEAQSGEMIDKLIGPQALPIQTHALIINKAEGNPYYIEELIHSLIREEVLVQDARTGQWQATRTVTSLDLPDSLRSLLLARIDDLSSEERRVLQMAAVIGSVFWSNVLRSMVGDRTALRQHLTALQRAQLIRERGHVPDLGIEYAFQSTLIRDVVYESVLKVQRVAHHLKVAEYLEDFFWLESLVPHYDMLADHYRQAGKPKKEFFYTLQAAEQAKGIYANAEAVKHYTRALELLDEMEAQTSDEDRIYAIRTQRFEVLNGRREVYFLMGDPEMGRDDARALIPLARQLADDPAWLIDALLQQPGVADWRSKEELDAGTPMAQQALDLARQLGDHHREMQCLAAMAGQRIVLDDPTAWELAEHALELSRQLGDRRFEVNILIEMGKVSAWDQPERGIEYLEAALPLSQALDDKITELNLLDLIGMQFERRGDYYRLLTEYQQKRLQISREVGHRLWEGHALMFCGQIQGIYLGDHDAALGLLEDSRRMREGGSGEMFVLLRVVQVLVAQGKYDEALKTLECARHLGEQNIYDVGRAGLDLVSAIVYNALGDEAHLRQALELAAQTRQLVAERQMLPGQYGMAAACESAAAHLGLAKSAATEAQREADCRAALCWSQAALNLYETQGGVQIIECLSEEILYRHGLALAANGRQAEAAEYFQSAYAEMMRKHALIPPDSPFRRTYLENIPLHRSILAIYAVNPA